MRHATVILALIVLLACCPAGRTGSPVVNADQTVIMVWNPETKTQHFIRKASFKSSAQDLGFLVPTPSIPELAETGNDAFGMLAMVTAPEVIRRRRSESGGCLACGLVESKSAAPARDANVTVLAEARVAGFDAKVLEATSADALVEWLNQNGYEFSPEVAAWAQPYIVDGWKITALKVASDSPVNADAAESKLPSKLEAKALRISFRTERPLFPYREPDPTTAAAALQAKTRMLRIFFVSDKRYHGELTPEQPWTGSTAWAGKLSPAQTGALDKALQLPPNSLPSQTYLTEFEDLWPYRAAPADVYFAPSKNQLDVRRLPEVLYVDNTQALPRTLAIALCVAAAWYVGRRK